MNTGVSNSQPEEVFCLCCGDKLHGIDRNLVQSAHLCVFCLKMYIKDMIKNWAMPVQIWVRLKGSQEAVKRFKDLAE